MTERSEILDMMGQLQLAGMRAVYDEIVSAGVKRQHGVEKVIGALLKASGLTASSGEGNRLIDGGGVRLDSSVVSDKGLKLGAGCYLLQVGKRKFVRVTLD